MTPDALLQELVGAQSEAGCPTRGVARCMVAVDQREGLVILTHHAIRVYPDGWPGDEFEKQSESRRKELLTGYLKAGHEGKAWDFEKGAVKG